MFKSLIAAAAFATIEASPEDIVRRNVARQLGGSPFKAQGDLCAPDWIGTLITPSCQSKHSYCASKSAADCATAEHCEEDSFSDCVFKRSTTSAGYGALCAAGGATCQGNAAAVVATSRADTAQGCEDGDFWVLDQAYSQCRQRADNVYCGSLESSATISSTAEATTATCTRYAALGCCFASSAMSEAMKLISFSANSTQYMAAADACIAMGIAVNKTECPAGEGSATAIGASLATTLFLSLFHMF